MESDWLPCSVNPLPEESPLAKVARCLAGGGEVWLPCGSVRSCLLGEGHWNRAVLRILPLISRTNQPQWKAGHDFKDLHSIARWHLLSTAS